MTPVARFRKGAGIDPPAGSNDFVGPLPRRGYPDNASRRRAERSPALPAGHNAFTGDLDPDDEDDEDDNWRTRKPVAKPWLLHGAEIDPEDETPAEKSWFNVPKTPGGSAAARSAAKFAQSVPASAAASPPARDPVRMIAMIPQPHQLGLSLIPQSKRYTKKYSVPYEQQEHTYGDLLRAHIAKHGLDANDFGDNPYPRSFAAKIGYFLHGEPATTNIAHYLNFQHYGGHDKQFVPHYLDRPISDPAATHADDALANQLYVGLTDKDLDRVKTLGHHKTGKTYYEDDDTDQQALRKYYDEVGHGVDPRERVPPWGRTIALAGNFPADRVFHGHEVAARLPHDWTPRQFLSALHAHLGDRFGYHDFPLEQIVGTHEMHPDDVERWGRAYRDQDAPGYQDEQGVWQPGHWMDAFKRARAERRRLAKSDGAVGRARSDS